MSATFDKFIGVPFVDEGRTMSGCDCWGLVMLVFQEFGIVVQDYKISCTKAIEIDGKINDEKVDWIECDKSNPPVPSLVVMSFNRPGLMNHTGVYIGDGKFIHTAEKLGCHIDTIDSIRWKNRIHAFYIPKEVKRC